MQQDPQNQSMLYKLARSIPFVFDLFNKDHHQSDKTVTSYTLGNPSSTKSIGMSGSGDMENKAVAESVEEVFDQFIQESTPQKISVESFSSRFECFRLSDLFLTKDIAAINMPFF